MTKLTLPTPRPLLPAQVQAIRQLVVEEVTTSSQGERSRRAAIPRRRWVPAFAAVAAVTVGVTVGIDALSTGNAYASWTAVPDQLQGGALASAGAACQQRLAAHFTGQTVGLTPAVAEKRGKFSAALIEAGSRVGVCINGIPNGQLGGILDLSPAPRSGLSLDANPGLVNGPAAVRQAIGQVANRAITRVVITTEDGRQITASAGGGLYLAWWPSGSNVRTVTGYSSSGAIVATAR